MADMKFRVKAFSKSAMKTVVKARDFEIIVDEPTELGGSNAGANPVEYVLAAFAGCLNVMGHIVAGEMKMNLNGLEIELSGDLNPAKLFGQSDEERAGYKHISVVLKPNTDADEQTLTKWVETIEERCPVSDNIQNITPVTLSVKKS